MERSIITFTGADFTAEVKGNDTERWVEVTINAELLGDGPVERFPVLDGEDLVAAKDRAFKLTRQKLTG